MNLQHLANNFLNLFTDPKGVTKSRKLAKNALERVEVPMKRG
jgi:hypothetical protein